MERSLQHCWLHHVVLGPAGNRQAAPKKVCTQAGAPRSCAVKQTSSARETSVLYGIINVETIGSLVGKICSAGTSLQGGMRSRRRVSRPAFKEVCEEAYMWWVQDQASLYKPHKN